MTIEEVMRLVLELELAANYYDEDRDESIGDVAKAKQDIRAAILALVAQARDEEAEACAQSVYCNACAEQIRVRIAARAEGGTQP
jgi:hypothetical protein